MVFTLIFMFVLSPSCKEYFIEQRYVPWPLYYFVILPNFRFYIFLFYMYNELCIFVYQLCLFNFPGRELVIVIYVHFSIQELSFLAFKLYYSHHLQSYASYIVAVLGAIFLSSPKGCINEIATWNWTMFVSSYFCKQYFMEEGYTPLNLYSFIFSPL